MATDRLFFALRPDAETAARIHQLALRFREVYGLKGRALAEERLHVTLCFLGNYDGLSQEPVEAADAAGKSLRAAPFDLTFDRVMSFQRSHGLPLVLCRDDDCAALTDLRNRLIVELIRCGRFDIDPRGFKPHVTLLYDEREIALQEVASISWTVTEVLLIRSLIGRGRHEVLRRYPLS